MTLPGFDALSTADPAKAIGETLTYIKRNHPDLADIPVDIERVTDAVWARIMSARWRSRQDVMADEIVALRSELDQLRRSQ